MRKNHEHLCGRVVKENYPELPDELKEFNYYYMDDENGHVIMTIPKCLLEMAEENGDFDLFECPFPVKYVLNNGYMLYKNHVICDGEFDPIFGLEIDIRWYEIEIIF